MLMEDQSRVQKVFSKLYYGVKIHQTDTVLVIAIALITITSYNLGKISVSRNSKTPVTILEPDNFQDIVRPDVGEGSLPKNPSTTLRVNQPVLVSKKSKSKLYHFTWCPGAGQIAEANKLTFTNEQAAITAGYTLAGNCKK